MAKAKQQDPVYLHYLSDSPPPWDRWRAAFSSREEALSQAAHDLARGQNVVFLADETGLTLLDRKQIDAALANPAKPSRR